MRGLLVYTFAEICPLVSYFSRYGGYPTNIRGSTDLKQFVTNLPVSPFPLKSLLTMAQ